MLKYLIFLLLLSSVQLEAQKYILVSESDKRAAKDLTFLVTFDQYTSRADIAAGNPVSTTQKDMNLLLRGCIGFDTRQAYKPEPGEDLKYQAVGNADPHQGTLIMWVCPQDYVPGAKNSRGNVAYAQLKFVEGGRFIDFRLYEYKGSLYFDWYSSEPPHRYQDVGRLSVPLKEIKKGEWFQVAASWSREIALYVNGKLVGRRRLPEKAAKTADLKPEAADSFIGIKNSFHGDIHKTGTAVDDFQIYSRALSALEISNQYNALLADRGEAVYRAFGIQLNGVDRGHGKDADQLEVEFDFSSLPNEFRADAKAGKLEISYTLTMPDGTRSKGQWHLGTGQTTAFFTGLRLPGEYVLDATLGKYQVSAKITRPDLSYIGNGIGNEDTVPAIWKDFKANGRKITLWNRIYAFNAGPLPNQIFIKGRPLFAEPPTLVIDGKAVSGWKAGAVDKLNCSVTYHGSAEIDGGGIDYATTIEFDGLIRFNYTIKGEPSVASMKLKWKLNPEFCQFLMRPEVYQKRGPAELLFYNGMDNSARELWFVSEDYGGFAYSIEHDANWVYDPQKPVYRADPASGECEVRMITRPVTIPEAAPYHALFIATPTRPLPQPFRVVRHNDISHPGSMCLTQIGSLGALTGPSTYEPHPVNFSVMAKNWQPHSQGVYGMANAMTTASPHAVYFRKYWEIPGAASYTFSYLPHKSVKPEKHTSISSCNATSQPDLYLFNMNKLLHHEYSDRLSSIYFDLCGNNLCSNKLHGCGFTDRFGREIHRFSLLAKRKLIERTVRLAHNNGKLVLIHAQRDFYPMLQGLGDFWFPGEQFEPMMARTLYPFTDEIPDIIYRSELNRNVIGTGVLLWTSITSLNRSSLSAADKQKATEAMFAALLLYDIDCTAVWAYTPVCTKIWNILEKYQVQSPDTVFHRFDRQQEIQSSNNNVRVSWYECPGKQYVLILSNTDLRAHTGQINLAKFNPGRIQEEYKGIELKAENGKFTIRIPARSFRIVTFQNK